MTLTSQSSLSIRLSVIIYTVKYPDQVWWHGGWVKRPRKIVGSRTEPESVELGRLQEVVDTGWWSRWNARGHAQMGKNLGNHGGIFNGPNGFKGPPHCGHTPMSIANTCVSHYTPLMRTRYFTKMNVQKSLISQYHWFFIKPQSNGAHYFCYCQLRYNPGINWMLRLT